MQPDGRTSGVTSQPHLPAAVVVRPPIPRAGGRIEKPTRLLSSRRQFIAGLALAPFALAAVALLRRLHHRGRLPPVAVPADVPVGLSFAGDIVLHRSASGVRAFSARCTHLGCQLQRVVDGLIVCSCHGSRFHSDGRVAAGPAVRPLPEMRVTPDAQTGGWTVDVG